MQSMPDGILHQWLQNQKWTRSALNIDIVCASDGKIKGARDPLKFEFDVLSDVVQFFGDTAHHFVLNL